MPEVNKHEHDWIEIYAREDWDVHWCSKCGRTEVTYCDGWEGHKDEYEVGSRKPIITVFDTGIGR